jgi:hypothetical protein
MNEKLRLTADMRFAPRLGTHPNCSLRSQILISAKRYTQYGADLNKSNRNSREYDAQI